jgi:hypothetical protein
MITTTIISSTRVNPDDGTGRARAALRNRRQSEGVRMEILPDIDGWAAEVEVGSTSQVSSASGHQFSVFSRQEKVPDSGSGANAEPIAELFPLVLMTED